MSIQFEISENHPDFIEDELFSKICINAIYNNEAAGFVSVIYINDETYQKKLKTPLDYFIYKVYQGNNEIRSLYENKDNDLLKFVKNFKEFGSTYEDITDNINECYSNQHQNFIKYWVNKPVRDLTYVYDGSSNMIKNYQNDQYIKHKNFRKLGIGKALLEKSMEIVNEKNLSLWESNTKTIQGAKFWQVAFENFIILNSKDINKDFPEGRKFCVSKT